MNTKRNRFTCLLAHLPTCLLVAAGCAASPANDAPPPAWIVGKYAYSGNGVVAKKFPWDAKADLLLEKDGQYTMSVSVHVNDDNGGDTDTDESYGTYYVDGGKVVLEPGNADDSDHTEELEIRGRRLVPKLPWTARMALKGFKIPDPEFVKSE